MSYRSPKKSTFRMLDPVYALVGATNLTTDVLRDLGRDVEPRSEASLFERVRDDVRDIARGVTRVPGVAREEVQARYDELAERGQEAVSAMVPFARRVQAEGRTVVDAQDAKARREARRLARQAEATVERGRGVMAEMSRVAERTLGAVRRGEPTEVVQVVTGVSGSESTRLRRAAARRAAVVDTAVGATSPAGSDEPVLGRFSSVEAGGTSAARRAAARRAVEADLAAEEQAVRRMSPAGVTGAQAAVVARRAARRQGAGA